MNSHENDTKITAQPLTMRLDKWLWVARFFKTRQLAIAAVNGGKVHLNGQRSKPSKEVKIGSKLRIHKGILEWEVEVLGLATQRRPASEAALLYREFAESVAQREKMLVAERLNKDSKTNFGNSRPSKKDRRQIHRFTSELD